MDLSIGPNAEWLTLFQARNYVSEFQGGRSAKTFATRRRGCGIGAGRALHNPCLNLSNPNRLLRRHRRCADVRLFSSRFRDCHGALEQMSMPGGST